MTSKQPTEPGLLIRGNKVLSLKHIHPGRVLKEKFLLPRQVTQNELARSIGVSPRRINEIILEKRIVTPDTALRLAKFFSTSAYFWLNLQIIYDVAVKKEELKLVLQGIKPKL